MKDILDFLTAALPWVGIGLMVAVTTAVLNAKKEGKDVGKPLIGISWGAFACFLFVAGVDFLQGDTSGATTWLVLGIVNALLNASAMKETES